ncbi:hypothetical protein L195_g019709 [Trifolium pratense]|uniref:Uncharacterized protein n=1 Tax=Trifolium pratense TaxID=57577 RepID=A0A2K3LT19_TRIPR|nr:hypothetical protein L195_g037714 [Trifolium pratense]PNX96501.1 hypothetical protein L195_g019709 [Trifolium pratense]
MGVVVGAERDGNGRGRNLLNINVAGEASAVARFPTDYGGEDRGCGSGKSRGHERENVKGEANKYLSENSHFIMDFRRPFQSNLRCF